MQVSVAIVNWNSGPKLRVCLESLFAVALDTEVIVIDNASSDRSIEDAVENFRNRVNFVRNSANRGLAAAVNQAFAATSTPYVLNLNPDVRVKPGAIAMLEDFLNAHPRAGGIGGYVNEKYLPRNLPTPVTLIRENLGLKRELPRLASKGEPVIAEQPAAAAMMIRRDAFDEIGGVDEQFYPAWYEDVDFCFRLNRAGWEIYFAPQAEFLHEGGYSAEALGAERFLQAYYRNQLRFAQKHFGLGAQRAVRASIAAGMLARMATQPQKGAAYAKTFWGAVVRW